MPKTSCFCTGSLDSLPWRRGWTSLSGCTRAGGVQSPVPVGGNRPNAERFWRRITTCRGRGDGRTAGPLAAVAVSLPGLVTMVERYRGAMTTDKWAQWLLSRRDGDSAALRARTALELEAFRDGVL